MEQTDLQLDDIPVMQELETAIAEKDVTMSVAEVQMERRRKIVTIELLKMAEKYGSQTV